MDRTLIWGQVSTLDTSAATPTAPARIASPLTAPIFSVGSGPPGTREDATPWAAKADPTSPRGPRSRATELRGLERPRCGGARSRPERSAAVPGGRSRSVLAVRPSCTRLELTTHPVSSFDRSPLARERSDRGSGVGSSLRPREGWQTARLLVRSRSDHAGRGAMSPTLLTDGPYRFFFFLNERDEPPHVHVQEGRKLAKLWLSPVSVASSRHFAAHELTELLRIVRLHRVEFEEAWHGRFPASS